MNDWTEGIQNALTYMEENLAGNLEVAEIAKRAYVSPFYFQRIFAALCGISVGEYIRNRRLTLAGQELTATGEKIIDIAAKYDYDSPDSFNRAFQRFHGITPSAARKNGAQLRSFAPVKIKLTLEGGNMLEYKIVEKPQFTVVGIRRRFHSDTSYQEIPQFWSEVMGQDGFPLMGMYGICMDLKEHDGIFDYYIADNYIPWEEIPEGCEVVVIRASIWAVFPVRGALPKALQDVNTRMWSEWLPNCKNYRLSANLNIEMYTPPAEKPEDNYNEIWLPVERIG